MDNRMDSLVDAFLYFNISEPFKAQKLYTRRGSYHDQYLVMTEVAAGNCLAIQTTFIEESGKLRNGFPEIFASLLEFIAEEPNPVTVIIYNIETLHSSKKIRQKMIDALLSSKCVVLEAKPLNGEYASVRILELNETFQHGYFGCQDLAKSLRGLLVTKENSLLHGLCKPDKK